jgi:hypothetical protein
MCRAGNVVNICFNHMSWNEDALTIKFAHQENDQTGDKGQYERHIYANPQHPEICPILTLGIYMLTHPVQSQSTHFVSWELPV